MKAFSTYQYLAGEPMTNRDKLEVGSKFWNKGKWDNFVLPFLKERGTLVDMGCNAGLFLKEAEEIGFKAIGVDSDPEAIKRGKEWRDKNGYGYKLIESKMEDVLDSLPMSDYTILANVHYYFYIADWLRYLDKLQNKTRYCIVVTADKMNSQPSLASADYNVVRQYFKDWDEVGFIDALPLEGDPMPRKLWGLCFKSRHIERAPMEFDCANHVQDKFYYEIEKGKDFRATKYYRILKGYRKTWTQEQLDEFIQKKMKLYADIKERGQIDPIIVGNGRVLDGNHRYSMLKHLGITSVYVRKI